MVVVTTDNNLPTAALAWYASQVSYTWYTLNLEVVQVTRGKYFTRPTAADLALTDCYDNKR